MELVLRVFNMKVLLGGIREFSSMGLAVDHGTPVVASGMQLGRARLRKGDMQDRSQRCWAFFGVGTMLLGYLGYQPLHECKALSRVAPVRLNIYTPSLCHRKRSVVCPMGF